MTMGKEKILENALKECTVYTFSNLEIYFTSEIKESDLKPYYFSHYIEAYLLSNYRLSNLKREIDNISNIDSKEIKIFLTTDKGVYQEILQDEGMMWVEDSNLKQKFGFVSRDINVIYIDYKVLTKYLPPQSYELDSLCHEFTHILLPQYLDMDWEKYNRYWNNIFDEGFAVLLNKQYKYIFNMRKDIQNIKDIDFREISIKYLKENGFFTIDNRFVTENFEYQYCASIVKRIDELIIREQGEKNTKPLKGLFSYILNKEDKGKSVEEDLLKDFGIDIKDIEEELRRDLDMS
ncbi:MAG: hypothetical protein XD93_0606 [candidate division WS6 bacterium 34_10]|uniref:Peptidase MA-like domain-containing protein n=1 Tax=candidate division WS6 bacterium 34_10 TaxID=1641389 RepID=A0A101HHJ9_9BACT|nr:MAG: hypothetical protein XD93_0606 [candidate division WS6 bacterium 34_10]